MSEDIWGPWIEHDRVSLPFHLVGMTLEIEAELHTGEYLAQAGYINSREEAATHLHWDWSWFGKPSGQGWAWARVIRYRIRKPRALRDLIQLVESLPEPTQPERIDA